MELDPDGLRVRREVLGDAHVDRALAATTPFSARFQEFITRTAWGDVWARPGLERRERSLVTLAALVALRAEGELAMHVRAAIGSGRHWCAQRAPARSPMPSSGAGSRPPSRSASRRSSGR